MCVCCYPVHPEERDGEGKERASASKGGKERASASEGGKERASASEGGKERASRSEGGKVLRQIHYHEPH